MPPSKRKAPPAPPKGIGRDSLAGILGVTPRHVSNLVKAGMPHVQNGGNALFDPSVCVQWYLAYRIEQERKAAQPSDREELELAKLKAQGELLDMQVRQEAGQLVTLDYMTAQVNGMMQRLRAKLLVLPGKAAPQCVGLDTIDAAVEVLEFHVEECMQALAATGDDVDEDDGQSHPDHVGA